MMMETIALMTMSILIRVIGNVIAFNRRKRILEAIILLLMI